MQKEGYENEGRTVLPDSKPQYDEDVTSYYINL